MIKKSRAEDVEDLIAEIRAKCVGGHFVFRGTTSVRSTVDDGVNSSLYRWAKQKEVIDDHYKPSEIEKEIVEKAKKHFPDKTSNIEILTVLRHFEGNVNLIDFSRNLYVALFFACHGEIEFNENGEITTGDGEITIVDEDKCEKLEEIDYEKLASGKLGIIEPSQIQESKTRAAVQGSVFLYSADGYIDKKLCTHHTIPLDLKEHVLNHIEEFNNINVDTIYNDIIGFISNEKNYETAAMYFYQGNKEARSENYKEAIQCYDKAIVINSKFAMAYYVRGLANALLGNHKKAIADYDQAIALNPKHAKAYHMHGLANALLDNHKEAIADYDQAIALNRQDAEVYHVRGRAKQRMGDEAGAKEDFAMYAKLTKSQNGNNNPPSTTAE